MKKSLLLVLTIAAFIFTGCGGSSEGLDPAAGEKQEQAADNAVPETTAAEQGTAEDDSAESADVASAEDDAVSDTGTTLGEDVVAAKAIEETSVYFDFDKFNIRDDMVPVVKELAEQFKEYDKSVTIKVEGNCDEWGTDEYNYALGLKRAKSVKDALAGYGVDVSVLKLISYGESNPVCTEKTTACWAKNRRVEFTIAD